MSTSVFKRCACSALIIGPDGQPLRGPNGRPKRRDLSSTCPNLKRADGAWNPKHGTWFFQVEVVDPESDRRTPIRHGGYQSRDAATTTMYAVGALLAAAESADNALTARMTIASLIRTRLTRNEPLPDITDVYSRLKAGAPLETDLTVGTWLKRWLAAKKDLRPATHISYSGIIDNYLVPMLGHHRLDRLRPGHIRDAMNEIAASAENIRAANQHRHQILALSKQAWREHDATTAKAARASLKELPPFRRPPNAATVQRIRSVLRAALTDACHEQLITINPAKLVKLPSGKAPKGLIWTPGRVAAWRATGEKPAAVMVWTAPQTTAFLRRAAKHRLNALYMLIAYHGLRRGEAVGLRWEDLDLDNATVTIRWQLLEVGGDVVNGAPKTDSGERTLILAKPVLQALRDWETTQARERRDRGSAWTDTKLVFTRSDGTALRPAQISDWFLDLAREASLPPIRLHDLRHGTATHLLTSGVEMKVVSEILGHSNLAITADLYTAVVDELKKNAARTITNIFSDRARPDDCGDPLAKAA
ncbi:integrase [Catenulispora sp. MAP5-51]|uniref:tyrosine-type recombinase/integrase n=1 Tax=Catenulispora sp. MAP5-51 TaxID=3156298 RepID=UPI003517443B